MSILRWNAAAGLVTAGAVVWTWLSLYPPLPPDLGGARDLDGDATHVRIGVAPGDSLDAWVVRGERPAGVVLLHGYGRDHHRVWRYGGFLNRAGYWVVAYDARSSRRAGRLPTTLGHHEVEDAAAVLRFLRDHPVAPGVSWALFGESLGGSVALVAAASDTSVRAVIADSGFSDGRQALRDACSILAPPLGHLLAPPVRLWGRVWTGVDPAGLDALSAARALEHRPVFFIHGTRDWRVRPAQTVALWEAAGRRHPLWLVEGAGHNQAWRRHPDRYAARVLEFLEGAIAAPRAAPEAG
jgi:pimeloyl-ACP methyl ester carboxylesterase